MEITNIKRFSEVYNKLREYFNKIEPCTYQQEPLFPELTGPLTIKKKFNANNWDVPCSSDTFKRLYDSFIEELDNAVLDYPQYIVQTMLKAYFSNLEEVFEYSLEDVFKFGREDLIELIELFNKSTTLICNLRNDSRTTYEYGVIGYYDSYREETMKRREKRISKPQVKEETYTDEEVEKCIEKMLENGKIDAIVNETTHEFLDDKTIKNIQEHSLQKQTRPLELKDYFHSNERIMQTFINRTQNKSGKAVAIEIKALCELGIIDFSNKSSFLRAMGINKSQEDGITRYFRQSSHYCLDSSNENVVAAKKHYE